LKILRATRVVLLLASAILLPGAAVAAANGEAVTLQLNWKHQFQFAGYYAAIEHGYYREAGFDAQRRSRALIWPRRSDATVS